MHPVRSLLSAVTLPFFARPVGSRDSAVSTYALPRALLSAALAFVPALAVVAVAAPAAAEPPVGAPAEVTLGWPDLGLIPDVQLTTNTGAAFTVPVPAGLNPVRLRGLIQAPVNIGSGKAAALTASSRAAAIWDSRASTVGATRTPDDCVAPVR